MTTIQRTANLPKPPASSPNPTSLQEVTPMNDDTTPLPAPGTPHAFVAVERTHSDFADRPEWDSRARVIPAWDTTELDHVRKNGLELLPISPSGERGTRWGVEPLPMRRGVRLRNLLGAEVVLIEPVPAAFAPGLWRVSVNGFPEEFATEAGLLACNYAPVEDDHPADA